MIRKTIVLIILISIILVPDIILAKDVKSILILVDSLSIDKINELKLDNYSIGLINLKTRTPLSEEGLYLSINTGRKISLRDINERDSSLEFLGDVLKKEKSSFLGQGKGELLIGNREGKVDYKEENIIYDYNWLVKQTENLLNKSNVLLIAFELNNESYRIDILSQYLKHYKNNQIIVLPKKVAKENKYILNKYLAPIIYINGEQKGLLTSVSTNRPGFIALEDVSVQLKGTYGTIKRPYIGNRFQIVESLEPLRAINNIYKKAMNMLIIAYIFHGFVYFMQVMLGIWLLRRKKIHGWLYNSYELISVSICISILLGLFEFHNNIILYIGTNIFVSYLIIKLLNYKGLNLVKIISPLTYGGIAFGTFFYPKMIYNSYMGFNNLVYGARYYGLNNGIMGVLLGTSILVFLNINRSRNNLVLKRMVGIFIFILNIVILSARFGANTGGFITSIILLCLIIYMFFYSYEKNTRRLLFILICGIPLFIINMVFDNRLKAKSHAIRFFYRLKENGIKELISMLTFKIIELLKLTFMPPFSIVILFQIIALKKLVGFFNKNNEMKKEVMLIIITSLVGFILNDTGAITFIYMTYYLILHLISSKLIIE